MIVCRYCLQAIESHEGNQIKKKLDWYDWNANSDENDEITCDWCEENFDSDMYEI